MCEYLHMVTLSSKPGCLGPGPHCAEVVPISISGYESQN